MKARIFYWSVTSALAGFLFGFDTVVISGAEQKIQALWGLSAGMHGLAMGAALYGTVLGSLCGGCLAAALRGIAGTGILLAGNCASGYFVRSGRSASFAAMAWPLDAWVHGTLGERR